MSDDDLPGAEEQGSGLILESRQTEKRLGATWIKAVRWIYVIIAAVAAASILIALFLHR